MNDLLKFLSCLWVIILIPGCEKEEGSPLKDQAELLSFGFVETLESVDVTSDEKTIEFELHFKYDVSSLTAVFDVSEGASVFVEDVEQVSKSTVNDFTDGIEYTIVSENGKVENKWIVSVASLPEPLYSVSTLVPDFPGNDGISVDDEGNIYVNSNGSLNAWNGTTIYKVTPEGSYSLFANNLHPWPVGSVIEPSDNLLISGWSSPGVITRVSLVDGSKTELYSGIFEASGIELDKAGNLYVMEPPTNSMLRFDTDGNRSVFATGRPFNKSSGITYVQSSGDFFVSNWNDGVISKVSPSGEVSSFTSLPVSNLGPIINDGEFLYVTSYNFHQVFSVQLSNGEFETIAGTGDKGNKDDYGDLATFNSPLGLGMSPDGQLIYVSEISPSGRGRLRVIEKNKTHQ